MSFSIPTYLYSWADIYIDGGYYGWFKSWHSYLVYPGTHYYVLIGHYYNGGTFTWRGYGTTQDCLPFSFIAN